MSCNFHRCEQQPVGHAHIVSEEMICFLLLLLILFESNHLLLLLQATISAGCIEGISRVFLKCVYFCWTTATSSRSKKMRWAGWICWKSSPLTATNWPTFQPVYHRRRSRLCTWRAIELRPYGLQISSVSDDWISFIWRPTLLSRSRRGLSIN